MKLFRKKSIKKEPSKSKNKFNDIIVRSLNEYQKNNRYLYDIKINTIQVYEREVKNWSDKDKIDFILYNIPKIHDYRPQMNKGYDEKKANLNYTREGYIKQLFKTKLIMNENDIVRLIGAFTNNKSLDWSTLHMWPLSQMLNQIYTQYKSKVLT